MKLILTILAILMLTCSVNAQSETIRQIRYEGLERIKPEFIEKFASASVGGTVDSSQAILDCQLMRQLPSVYHADVRWEQTTEGVNQVFQIQEAHTLVPYIYLGQGGEMTSRTFQLGVSEFNLLGRGIWLMADYQYKQRHSGSVSFRIPFIGGRPWNIGGAFKHWNTLEPLYFGSQQINYSYQTRYGQVTLSRLINLQNEVGISAAVFDETYHRMELAEEEIAPSMHYFQKRLLQVFTRIDRTRPHFFYQRGTITEVRFTTVFNRTIPDERFEQMDVNFRYYSHRRRKWNGAVRAQAGLSTHREGPFSPYVFDSQLNLRGAGDRVARGTATILAHAEWRYTAFDTSRFAIQIVGFADMGWLRQAGDDKMSMTPRAYGGGGIRVHAKRFYNAILRVDYGQGIVGDNKGGFVIGLGQFF